MTTIAHRISSISLTWFDICFKRINHSGCCIENGIQRGKANIDRNLKFGNYLIPWQPGRTRWDVSPLIPLTPTSALLSQLIISLFSHSLAIIFWNMTRWVYHGRLVMDNSPSPFVSVNCPLLSFSYFHGGNYICIMWLRLCCTDLFTVRHKIHAGPMGCFPRVCVVLRAQSLAVLLRSGGVSLEHVVGISFHHGDFPPWKGRIWFWEEGKNKAHT